MAGSLGNGGDGGTSGTGRRTERAPAGVVDCTVAVAARECYVRCGWLRNRRRRGGGGGGGSSLVPSDMGKMQLASFATAPMVGIAPVPRPTCRNVTRSTPYALGVVVRLNCTEFAGQPLTYSIVRAPAHGRLSGLKAAGRVTVTYTPAAHFVGTDSFTYDASSTNGTSIRAAVSIRVTPRSVAGAGHARWSGTGAKIPIACTAHGVGAAVIAMSPSR